MPTRTQPIGNSSGEVWSIKDFYVVQEERNVVGGAHLNKMNNFQRGALGNSPNCRHAGYASHTDLVRVYIQVAHAYPRGPHGDGWLDISRITGVERV
jgi:hypothetical protein